MSGQAYPVAKAVAKELQRRRNAAHYQHQVLAWPISEGCYFWVSLTGGNSPLVGVALPQVHARASKLLGAMGLFQPDLKEIPAECMPSFPIPWQLLIGTPDPDGWSNEFTDADALARSVEVVLHGESLVKEVAGDVSDALDFARTKMPFAQTPPFFVPVGYGSLGRRDEAERFIAECKIHFASGPMADLYDSFVAKLREDWTANSPS